MAEALANDTRGPMSRSLEMGEAGGGAGARPTGSLDPDPPGRLAWRPLSIIGLAVLLLHVFTAGRYGIFRDEYYYLACAARPDLGYVDHPPLSIWILSVWTQLFGDGVASIRILPALCGAAMAPLAGATAAAMGGGRWAQIVAALSVVSGVVTLVVSGFYSMNAFDLLFWLGAYYFLIRMARSEDGRWWIPFGLLLGLGLTNKIGLLVLGAALVVGLLLTRHRRQLRNPRLYAGGGIALVFLVPYAVWNARHDWPTLAFIENAKSGKIAAFTPFEFFVENVLMANPLTVPVWGAGLAWLLVAPSARRYQIVAWTFLATFALLVLQKSKPYYFAVSPPVILAAGGVAWERWTRGPRVRWVRWLLGAHLLVAGAMLAPMAVPLLSPSEALAHGQRLGMTPAPQEVGHTAELPQHFADRFGWERLAEVVSDVFGRLPEEERSRCVVIGQNYGHAGALEYASRALPLPPVYSTHNNYWLWGPPPDDATTAIVVRGDPERLRELFGEVTEAAVAESPDAIERSMTIFLCRAPRRPWSEVWAELRHFV